MRWIYKLPLRLRSLFRKKRVEQELSDELRFHLEKLVEQNIINGMTAEQARYAALREFGNVGSLKEECRDSWGVRFISELGQDIRYGLRQLRRNPGFTIVAVITLALGIGATTAIFSVVDALLIRPFPFVHAERLVFVWTTNPAKGWSQLPFSYPNFADLRNGNKVFEGTAGFFASANTNLNLSGKDRPMRVQAAYVSASFFRLLGVEPFLGVTFRSADDGQRSDRVAVISYGLWQRVFSGDPRLARETLTLDDITYTVVGVMPAGFHFPRFPSDADVWIPLSLDPLSGRKYSRGTKYLTVMARLDPHVSLAQAQAGMDVMAHELEEADPVNAGNGIKLVPLPKQAVGDLRAALLVLFGAVWFVLLIACTNVANLLLARGTRRRQEIAIRSALGAGRRRLARQILTECLILSFLGGLLGLLVAHWGIQLLSTFPYNAPSYFKPYVVSFSQISIDLRVFSFLATLIVVTAIVFGVAPTLQAADSDLQPALKDVSRSLLGGGNRQRLTHLLVVGEVALALVLVFGAGLMVRSFLKLQAVDPGFRPENLMVAEINLPPSKYSQRSQVVEFYRRLLNRTENLPGVSAAGLINDVPLGGVDEDTGFFIEGQPLPAPGKAPHTHPRVISTDYFLVMGIPLLAGRAFTPWDAAVAPNVAIINATMARRFWPGENPVGKRVALDYEAFKYFRDRPPELDLSTGWREIVGVVADVRHQGLETDAAPEMYTPYSQRPSSNMSLVVRAHSNPRALAGAIRNEVLAVDKDQAVSSIIPMTGLLAQATVQPRFNLELLGCFAGLALVLAGIGIYGVVAFAVSRRTREIGIRMALGAEKGDVLRMVVGEGLKLAVIGVAVGIAGALALTRFLTSLLYGVTPTDPLTFIAVSLIMIAVALVACYIPARRAAKVDPMVALRYE